ncbi:MAG: nickel-dependent hydrogenase large subunit, partial [Pseudomonadales bacterium]|nr:nickel-dependent hydrogenase large subunit [Pseudomonadales bacterium]
MTRRIEVGSIGRVEGEGALDLTVENGALTSVRLDIFEAPRYFEALLVGRDHREAPDLTARICGICPAAYQMSAVHALEAGTDTILPPTLRALRRLLYCGEWIESHALHLHLLHAPDFLGYQDAIQLAGDLPDVVKQALE